MHGCTIIANRSSRVATIGQTVSARRLAASWPGAAAGVTAVAADKGSWRPMSRIERWREGRPSMGNG